MKTLYPLFFLTIIAAFIIGFYYSSWSSKNPGGSTTSTTSQQTIPLSENSSISKLAFLEYVDEGIALYLVGQDGKNLRKILPTKGEKITQAAISTDGRKLLVIIEENGEKNLYTINPFKTDERAKIYSNYSFEQNPSLSSDNKKLTVISFSNADPNYGFSLKIKNLSEETEKIIYTNTSGILYPHWLTNNELVFVQEQDNQTQLLKIDISSRQTTPLLTLTGETVTALSTCDKTIVLAKMIKGTRMARTLEIYTLKEGEEPKKITSDQRAQNYPVCRQSGEILSFVLANYPSGNVSLQHKGDIMIWIKGETQRVGLGNHPLGFVSQ
mgnify:CR=1 FL=1